jgi:membrane protease YdiL (CAAX protease family)
VKKITDWIRRHQVLAFFILTFTITWPVFILYYFIFPLDRYVGTFLMHPAIFSPALVAMLIAAIAEPHPKSESSKPRWIAFTLSWLVCAPILILYGWKIQEMELRVAFRVYSLAALLSAWILSSAYARTPGIRKLFSTLLKPRGPVIYYLAILLIFPGILLLAMVITRLLGGKADFYLADMDFGDAAFFLLLEFLKGFVLSGGINEESGWRGFALPRLQKRYPVIVAALIVGFIWSMWHIPYDIGRDIPIAWILENRLFWNPLFAILLAWLYNRTHGSILAPAILHPAMNALGNEILITPAGRILFTGLALFAIIHDRMWKKLPADSLAVA